MLLFSRFK